MKNISKKWLIVLAVTVIALLAIGVPVLAASGTDVPGAATVTSGYARFCGMMRGWENTVAGCFHGGFGGGMWGCR